MLQHLIPKSSTYKQKTVSLLACFHNPAVQGISLYPHGWKQFFKCWYARRAACFNHGIPFLILMQMHPLLLSFEASYLFCISSGMCLYFVFMHSGSDIGVARKWSFISADIKRALQWVLEIALLRRIFVSSKFTAEAAESPLHVSISPPTVILILCCSSFEGLQSQTKEACAASLCVRTSD